MQVIEVRPLSALCHRRAGADGVLPPLEEIDTRLLAGVAEGDWLLTFLGAARSPLTATEAAQIDDALSALELVMSGGSVDHLFADLIDREPELPDHLRCSVSSMVKDPA